MTASLRFKKLDLQKSCKRKVVPTGTGEFFMFYLGVRNYSPPQIPDHENGCNSQIGIGLHQGLTGPTAYNILT